MSGKREELLQIVESLDEDGVRAVLAAAKQQAQQPTRDGGAWPPGWFNVGTAARTDVATRAEELLQDGFGRAR